MAKKGMCSMSGSLTPVGKLGSYNLVIFINSLGRVVRDDYKIISIK